MTSQMQVAKLPEGQLQYAIELWKSSYTEKKTELDINMSNGQNNMSNGQNSPRWVNPTVLIEMQRRKQIRTRRKSISLLGKYSKSQLLAHLGKSKLCGQWIDDLITEIDVHYSKIH